MPILEIHARCTPPENLFDALAQDIADGLQVDAARVAVLWHRLEDGNWRRKAWNDGPGSFSPVMFLTCRETHTKEQVRDALLALRDRMARELKCPLETVFAAVRRVARGELLVQGAVWGAEQG